MTTTTTTVPADFARIAIREALADRPQEVKWCQPELEVGGPRWESLMQTRNEASCLLLVALNALPLPQGDARLRRLVRTWMTS